MNFLDAVLHCGKDGYTVTLFGKELMLPESKQDKLKENGVKEQSIIAGIRSEDIFIVGPKEPGDCQAHVIMTEMMGNEVFVHVDIESHEAIVRLTSSMVEDADIDYMHKNIDINLSFNKERIHLFDKTKECSLV